MELWWGHTDCNTGVNQGWTNKPFKDMKTPMLLRMFKGLSQTGFLSSIVVHQEHILQFIKLSS